MHDEYPFFNLNLFCLASFELTSTQPHTYAQYYISKTIENAKHSSYKLVLFT